MEKVQVVPGSYLSKRGYVLRKDSLSAEELSTLKKELKGTPLQDEKYTFANSVDPTFPLYIETKNKMYIPKMYGLSRYGVPEKLLDNFMGLPWNQDIQFTGELYENQIEPVNILENELRTNMGGILSIATGGGKTISALNVLSKLKRKTIIIVNKISLLKQWEDEIHAFLPNAKVGIIQGQKNVDVVGKDIVIAMLQSLARIDYPDSLFDEFGSTVLDECFPYNTSIITKDGKVSIGELYQMKKRLCELPLVKTFNEETQLFEYKRILNVFKKENNTRLQLQCSKMKMISTENHRYLTTDGWKEAKDVEIGDTLKCHYDSKTNNQICPALNKDQYQIVLGSFLGDGHLAKVNKTRYRLQIVHCKAQYAYCKWKSEMFGIDNIRYIQKNGYANKEAFSFSTKTFIMKNNFPTNKTSVPQWVLDDLDERGLAIWFMDDGSISKKAFNANISTDSFDEDSQKRIVEKLESFGIECIYKKYKDDYFHIRINRKGTLRLIECIAPYIHDSMIYKIMTQEYILFLEDQRVDKIEHDTVFNRTKNIKESLKVNNMIYNVYNNNKKTEYHSVKYAFCSRCHAYKFHNKELHKYFYCNHSSTLEYPSLPVVFSNYEWSSKFLDFGLAKVTFKRTVEMSNRLKDKHVYDLEIEDNHNYIVSGVQNRKQNSAQNGFIVHNCHNVCSRVFSKVLMKLCSRYTIGLSATPKRGDGCEYIFKWFLGDVVFKSSAVRDGRPPIVNILKVSSKDYVEVATVNKFTNQKQIQFTSMLSELTIMPKRNKLIVELVKDLAVKENRRILVLSDRREHVKTLKKLLEEDLVPFTYGLFLGQMKSSELEKSKSCQVILATYQAFGEGVSEKDLDTLVLITPKKFIGHLKKSTKNESGKLEQIVGRIFRKEHINKSPLIIDINDNFSVYKNQSRQRMVFYKEHFPNALYKQQHIKLDDHELKDINTLCIKTQKDDTEEQVDSLVLDYGKCMLDD
jgi:superfamily II DNA or RNA helicase/intein/homing endonuclease